jgi:hypothetical protein
MSNYSNYRRNRPLGIGIPASLEEAENWLLGHEVYLTAFREIRLRPEWNTPGPDGLGANHFNASEMGEAVRSMLDELRRGVYRPGRSRIVQIPKANGGFRCLRISNVVSRLIEAVFYEVLKEFFQWNLPDGCFGGPNRGLAMYWDWVFTELERGRFYAYCLDIQDAFDSPMCLPAPQESYKDSDC